MRVAVMPVIMVMVRMVVVCMVMIVMLMIMMGVIILIGFEKIRLDFQNPIKIEGVAAEHGIERHRAIHGLVEFGVGVDCANARFDFAQFFRADKIGFVEQDDVGEGDLGSWLPVRPSAVPTTISHRPRLTTASSRAASCTSASTKKVCATGAGSARPVVSTMIASNLPLRFISPSMMRIRSPRTCAADTAVVHFEDFFVGADNEIVVDADLAEFIDDDGEFLAVRFAQDTIEQRRFARAEIAGENGDGIFSAMPSSGEMIAGANLARIVARMGVRQRARRRSAAAPRPGHR